MIEKDIFDLDEIEFENKINKLLESVTDTELLEELIDNGLILYNRKRKE